MVLVIEVVKLSCNNKPVILIYVQILVLSEYMLVITVQYNFCSYLLQQ